MKHAEGSIRTGSILSPGSTGIAAHSHDAPLSRLNLGSEPGRSPADMHKEALDVFLESHLSNLQALQDSLNRVSEPRPVKLDASGGVFDGGDGLVEECVNEFVGSILTVSPSHSLRRPHQSNDDPDCSHSSRRFSLPCS